MRNDRLNDLIPDRDPVDPRTLKGPMNIIESLEAGLDHAHDAPCDDCLRHSILLSRLAPHIQNVYDNTDFCLSPYDLTYQRLTDTFADRADVAVSDRRILDTLQLCADANVVVLCRHHPDYPTALREGTAPPPVLYAIGNLSLLDQNPVLITGTRRATSYGLEVTTALASNLAAKGRPVLSGLGLGIEGSAHRGAIQTGPTIAVLPAGIDRPYPASHTRLYRQIKHYGLVLSESPPGSDAWRFSFWLRNRLLLRLASRTVIVEGRDPGHTRNLARAAGLAGHPLHAVPGPVTSEVSTLPNALLHSGAALVCRNADDIPNP